MQRRDKSVEPKALNCAPLPPGQIERSTMPRFGLGRFAKRVAAVPASPEIDIRGDVAQPMRLLAGHLQTLPRVEQQSDFHCVTTWSVRDVRWSGWRFADLYTQLLVPETQPQRDAQLVVFRGADGYACCLPLADLLAPDVLLADCIDGQGLGAVHGAPLRLVAPAHYGYKNVKHIVAIEFWRDRRAYRFAFPYPQFMDHPRARVSFEERARWFPAWLLRPLYRALIPSTERTAAKSLKQYQAADKVT